MVFYLNILNFLAITGKMCKKRIFCQKKQLILNENGADMVEKKRVKNGKKERELTIFVCD